MIVLNSFNSMFFPTKLPDCPDEISFKSAVEAANSQYLARITKAALFALSSIAATITLVLTEAALITWPLAIPSIIISLITGVAFFRLNYLDQVYMKGLEDPKRADLIKHELMKVFNSTPCPEKDQALQTLHGVNRLLKCEMFTEELILQISNLYEAETFEPKTKSLATLALELNCPIRISGATKWFEQGRYGLNSYQFEVDLSWEGTPDSEMLIFFKQTEKAKEGEEEKAPIPLKTAISASDSNLNPCHAPLLSN